MLVARFESDHFQTVGTIAGSLSVEASRRVLQFSKTKMKDLIFTVRRKQLFPNDVPDSSANARHSRHCIQCLLQDRERLHQPGACPSIPISY